MMPQAVETKDHNENALMWQPTQAQMADTLMMRFKTRIEKLTGQTFPDYQALWQWSVTEKETFWSEFWDFAEIIGEKGGIILSNPDQMPGAEFFPEASLNYAENLLRKRGDDDALTFWGEDKVKRRLSHDDLYNRASQLAQYLRDKGVKKGDRVAAFISNMPEAIIGLLATSSIGAIWSSASPDFGVQGVLDRFGQIEPKIFLAVEGYYYNGKVIDCMDKIRKILPQMPSVEHTLVIPYANDAPDLSGLENAQMWDDALNPYTPKDIEYERVAFNHPLYIMFSSGTTGVPKCIVHGVGGALLTHMKEHALNCDTRDNDRVFYFTTCGWMMWNWQVTALACGATLCLFDGSPFAPDANILFDYADAEKFTLFGTSAKYIDALNKNNVKPRETHDLSSVRVMTSTGSPLVHESFDYVYRDIKADMHLASISGGTDIVSCFVLGTPITPVYRGEIQGAGLGYDMDVFDDDGTPIAEGAGQGELVCKSPFPSMPVMFWGDKDGSKYREAYFERFDNVWAHGDWVERTPNHGWIIYGRSDATLNPGGVRIGTAEIYRQVEQIPEVIESIAVGQDTKDGDVRVVLFVILKEGITLTEELSKRIKVQIRNGASPRHVPAVIVQVNDIPRTKSGKITEIAVKHIIHGREVKNKEALANPAALEEYKDRAELAL